MVLFFFFKYLKYLDESADQISGSTTSLEMASIIIKRPEVHPLRSCILLGHWKTASMLEDVILYMYMMRKHLNRHTYVYIYRERLYMDMDLCVHMCMYVNV